MELHKGFLCNKNEGLHEVNNGIFVVQGAVYSAPPPPAGF